MLHLRPRSSDSPSAVAEQEETPSAHTRPIFQAGLSRTFSSLSSPNFRLLWIGMLFTMAGMQITIVARAWLAYDLSGSGLVIGIVALARGFPQFCLAPFGGVAADRFNKRTLLIVTQAGLAFFALLTAVLIQFHLITVWQLVLIGFGQGCIYPFMMPTRTAYISDLVDEEHLPNALALDSTGRNLNRVVAPTLAGFLIAINPMIAFYGVAIAFAGSILTLVRLPNPLRHPFRSRGPLKDMVVSFRYVLARPVLIILIGMALLFVLLGMPYSQLLPVFQKSVFHVGPTDLGFMYTAVGLGAIIGSLGSAYLSTSLRKREIQLVCGFLFGAALAGFAVMPTFVDALPLLLVAGGMVEAYFTLNRILVILHTDRQYYGRVISLYSMSWAMMPAALIPYGALVDRLGARPTIVGGGLLLTLAVIALVLLVPSIRHTEAAPDTG